MDNFTAGQGPTAPVERPPFRRAALVSGVTLFLGIFLGFHFVLDPTGNNWGGELPISAFAFVICWGITLLALFLIHRRHRKDVVLLGLLFLAVGIISWAIFNNHFIFTHTFTGYGLLFQIFFVVTIFPVFVFGLTVGLLLLWRNGWKIALAVVLLGLIWVGYQFSLPRGDTRQQAVSSASSDVCKKSQALIRNDCYTQVAVTTKDVSVCDENISKKNDAWVDCYRKVAKATNRIDLCNVGADGDGKITCLKEVAINHKDLNACDTLPKTSGVAGTITYHQDCFRRVLDQLAIPTAASATADVAQWCRAAKAYPIYVTNGSAAYQAAYSQYCQ